MDKSKLAGRWAIVTGASSGIGLEFSRRLAWYGMDVLMVSNQPEALEQYAREIHDTYGVQTQALDLNLGSQDAVDVVVETLTAKGITPYVLVNNAGIFNFACASSLPKGRVDLYIDLHMRTYTHLNIAIGNMMAEAGGGFILNMSSMSCWMPMPGIALYSATKAYVRAFSRAFRIEMLDRGVSVTVACPGGIDTGLFGLAPNLRKLGVALGVLATPQAFARHALKRTFARRAQYINGPINRLSIFVIATLPEWARRLGKRKLLKD